MEQLIHQWNLITMIYYLLTENCALVIKFYSPDIWVSLIMLWLYLPSLVQHSLPLIQSPWWDDTLLRIWSILSLSIATTCTRPLHLSVGAVTAQLVQNKCTRLHEEIYFWTLSNTEHLGWINHFFYCQEQTKNTHFLHSNQSFITWIYNNILD